MKKSLKYIKSMGHAYVYNLSYVFTVSFQNRHANTKFTVSFPGKQRLSKKKIQNPTGS